MLRAACRSFKGTYTYMYGGSACQTRQLVSDTSLQFFKATLGSSGVVTDTDTLVGHNTDWMNKFRGKSKVMLKPRTSEEVSAILSHCNEHTIAVVPQGGNTGLCGGSVPIDSEIILNLSRMDSILDMQQVRCCLTARTEPLCNRCTSVLWTPASPPPVSLSCASRR